MIALEDKRSIIEWIHEAINTGTRAVNACEMAGISIRTFQRWRRDSLEDKRKGAVKKVPRKLTDEEIERVKETACLPEFRDLTPYEIVAILAENGEYIASASCGLYMDCSGFSVQFRCCCSYFKK